LDQDVHSRAVGGAISRRGFVGAAAAMGTIAATAGGAVGSGSPAPAVAVQDASPKNGWVGTWAAAPRAPFDWTDPTGQSLLRLTGRTFRLLVRVSVGGTAIQVRLTNAHAAEPVIVANATVSIPVRDATSKPDSVMPLSFGGRPSVTVPPEAVVVSDPIVLDIPSLGEVAISLHVPGTVVASPVGPLRAYASPPGDFAGEAAMPVADPVQTPVLLSGVDVRVVEPTASVVTLGDSLTEGTGATPDGYGRWPDVLAARLVADPAHEPAAVLNAGIGGNRLLRDGPPGLGFAVGASALARLDRDVFAQPGATHLVVLLGINDIGLPVLFDGAGDPATSDDIVAGLWQVAARAREHGLVTVGGTLTPFEGGSYFTQAGEGTRQAVNEWVRGGQAFDAVADFDAAVRDPDRPSRLLPAFDSGDHLHLNDAGYRAMGEAVALNDLRLAYRP
jgi:lysophospholipase L1-like esterase